MRRHCATSHAGSRRVHANTHTRASIDHSAVCWRPPRQLRKLVDRRARSCCGSLRTSRPRSTASELCTGSAGTLTHRRYSRSCVYRSMRAEPKSPSRASALPRHSRPCRSRRHTDGGGGARTQSQAARASNSAAMTPTTTPTAIFQRSAGFTPPPPPPLSVCGATTVLPDAFGASYVCARARPRQQPVAALLLAFGAAATLRARQSCTWLERPAQSSHERRGQPPLTLCAAWPLAALLSQLRRPARDRCCDALRRCPSGHIDSAGRLCARPCGRPVAVAAPLSQSAAAGHRLAGAGGGAAAELRRRSDGSMQSTAAVVSGICCVTHTLINSICVTQHVRGIYSSMHMIYTGLPSSQHASPRVRSVAGARLAQTGSCAHAVGAHARPAASRRTRMRAQMLLATHRGLDTQPHKTRHRHEAAVHAGHARLRRLCFCNRPRPKQACP